MDELSNVGAYVPLQVRKGSDFGPWPGVVENPDGTRCDLTGCSMVGQVRKYANDQAVVASLTVAITNATQGEFQISMPAAAMANAVAGNTPDSTLSQYVYDINVIDNSGRVIPFMQGEFKLFRWVTHG